jgi:hypothetical protein
MAGHFIAFQRMLRLQNALASTITSPEFIRLKVAKEETLLLKDDMLWQCIADIVRAAFPALRVLRLADQKIPGMDKLYYYVRKTDATLTTQADHLNRIASLEVETKLKSFFKTVKSDNDSDSSDDDSSDSDNSNESDAEQSEEDQSDDDDNDVTYTQIDDYVYGQANGNDIPKQQIVAKFRHAWGKRRKKLVNDYSITGWMLSPIPSIMADAKEHNIGYHRNAVERLIKKLITPSCNYPTELDRTTAVGALLNIFWTEHEQFHSKSGSFANREHIWISSDIQKGDSHLWHKKNSLHYTSVLGKLACLVCSKVLGIGSAERSWGDVKHLKSDKRSKMSGEATKMQSTIFGASCAERARLKQDTKEFGNALNPNWEDDDFADAGIEATNSDNAKPKRIFRAWLEDWEVVARSKQDPVNEAMFLEKYGGLVWFDPDTQSQFMASKVEMYWSKLRDCRGYCVKGLLDTYNPDKDDEKDWEPWVLDPEVFHCLIGDYYEKNPSSQITIVTMDELASNDEDEGE